MNLTGPPVEGLHFAGRLRLDRTHMPLQKWFVAISFILNAKKSLSSCQLARDLDMTNPTAWYMQQRTRAAMASGQLPLLKGIIEADETYVGGRPRRRRNRKDDDNQKKKRPRDEKDSGPGSGGAIRERHGLRRRRHPPDEASSTSSPERSTPMIRSSFQTNIKPMTSFEGSCLIPSSTTA